MRAKTQVHVEYEVFKALLDSEALGEVIEDLKQELVPDGDAIAEKTNEQTKNCRKPSHQPLGYKVRYL